MTEKGLSPAKIKQYEEILVQELENSNKLINQLSEMYKKGLKDNSGDLSGYAFHQADQGTDTHEQEKTAYLLDSEYQKIKQINLALKRIAENTFGLCAICGCQIPETRLTVIPYALVCIDCKTQEEKRKR